MRDMPRAAPGRVGEVYHERNAVVKSFANKQA